MRPNYFGVFFGSQCRRCAAVFNVAVDLGSRHVSVSEN